MYVCMYEIVHIAVVIITHTLPYKVGKVDLTADVDFAACARAAGKAGARPLPVSTQGDFLMRMGIVERAEVRPFKPIF